MGELEVVDQNGGVSVGEENCSGEWRDSPSPPDPALIVVENLSAAEEAAEQVLNCVHPTLDSEEKRRDVVDYVQQLVKSRLNCEAVSYGSVPLKTYLPDGDIDLTILKANAEESLPNDVVSLLENEEQNKNAEYQINDTQFIDAEVKLVKCFVQNIVVDITFNQLGGISTLCFLEQVDRLIGRNHLFKRSIILVKCWCYYESRILGAHHGLLSTYALETLVLYIFHFFHSSLSGPFAVLHRFLDYYSKFDWENCCISLKGPVHISSLPDIVVKMPDNVSKSVLLSEEFLENCMNMFLVPCKVPEANKKVFQRKHLNIIDPLKEYNNLGRSVHRGNFYRIRCAFKYGANMIEQLLLRPRDKIADETLNFFLNTHSRHGNRPQSSNMRHLVLEFSDQESLNTSSLSPVELLSDDGMLLKSSFSDFENDELDGYMMREISPETSSACESLHGSFISRHSNSSAENGSSEDKQNELTDSERSDFKHGSNNREEQVDNAVFCKSTTGSVSNLKVHISKHPHFDYSEIDPASEGGESEDSNPLADLSGDYDSNIRNLLTARLCRGFASSAAPMVLNSPSSPSRNLNKKPPPLENGFSQQDANTMSTNHITSPNSGFALLGNAFHFQGTQKARGLGTYFPLMSAYYIERAANWRGRNNTHSNNNNLDTYHNNNGLYSGKANYFENDTNETAPTRRHLGRRRSDVGSQSSRAVGGGNQINGSLDSSCRIEFGSVGNLAEDMISGSHVRWSTFEQEQESRVGGESIHLKNEDEFPPLSL